MRVLWFSITPSLFNPKSTSFNGGGWIASLEQIVRKIPEIYLGVAFMFPNSDFKYEKDGVTYYTIQPQHLGLLQRIRGKKPSYSSDFHRIIEDFKPDLIQIFGSENHFGEICNLTQIPTVIHMQGSLPPYHNALFPPGINTYDFLFTGGLKPMRRYVGLRSNRAFRKNAEMEIRTLQSCKNFMGRTEWDKNVVKLHNPDARYFHCEEALRDSFMNSGKQWNPHRNGGKFRIISVSSSPWYKGADLILKTAKLLKQFGNLDFEWDVYGVNEVAFFEHKFDIKAEEVNVNIKGVASKDQLVEALINSDCYVHASYIDNSPNSLCEAQYLGVPVLATFVGGIPSMVKDGEDGILFPANDPYTLASLLKQIAEDNELAKSLSEKARKRAIERHNPEAIGQTLLSIYKDILSCSHCSSR